GAGESGLKGSASAMNRRKFVSLSSTAAAGLAAAAPQTTVPVKRAAMKLGVHSRAVLQPARHHQAVSCRQAIIRATVVLFALLGWTPFEQAQDQRAGPTPPDAHENYAKLCAGCHGADA